ncbi:Esterase-like activity of phytase [Mesorhizobium albiziae]|uniref:Esterase-like activity of phytase n=1 Tax=Neomesorhizobium albiziae TaxID=335020 RepID=A0A1I3XHH1_9HYPH|nr:esterase-like activity of phytase family protein [Mesorhizobium albiziae]GLS30450.1 alkaline phosphatase [Mesorhizobium albiziae]SFK18955.1 Esterase-like activity of phytase [Mesorhizobium albiziae]
MLNSRLFALTAVLTASVALPAHADMMFNRVASFPVANNLPADADTSKPTSSEIITASEDGNTLVYSDSPLGAVGFIDITDARAPKAGGIVKIDGEPTSVTIAGGKVLAGVNTSKSKAEPSGNLTVIDLASKAIEAACDLGGQPDSVALSKDGKFLAVAIENERDEEVDEGKIPQMPSGNLKILSLAAGVPDCATIKTVELTGLSEIAPEDAEPEFVAFNDAGEIAVTLQENNHIAIVDAATAKVTAHFSAGSVTLENVDTKKDGALRFTGKQENVLREPDAVKWLDNDRLVVANEGDYKGGSRGFTIFRKTGEVAYESGPSFEYQVANAGHYPEARNKKGIEPEGIETGTLGEDKLLFVASERGSVVGVYKDTGGEPQFLQLLPSGIGPEGLVAIPSRNLLVTANETDLVEDGLARSHVMVFERAEGPATYPMITAKLTDEGTPLGWGALSALAAGDAAGKLFAASDSVYANAPAIFAVDATQTPAVITGKTVVTRDGNPAQKLDIEGLVADGEGGFWLANEGDPAKLVPHAILHVNDKGEISQEIGFPMDLLAHQTRFGLEGITTVGEGDDQMLVMAVQREWADDAKGQVKLVAYKPKAKEWSAVRYPLEAPSEGGWMGLSEITAHNGKLYVIERDNLVGDLAKVKRLYSVPLDGFKPAKLGGELPVVEKTLVRDLIPDLKSATNGYVVDKVEGFTIDKDGNAFVVTDNDGVDDSSGETLFLKLGNIEAVN